MLKYIHGKSYIYILLAGCLVAICSCRTLPVQNRHTVQSRLPETFISLGTQITGSRIYWKHSFPSDSLKADVLTLLEKNYQIAAARARMKKAMAEYGIADSLTLPSMNASAGFDRSRIKEITDSAPTTRNTFDIGTVLQWEPDIWGQLEAGKKAAALMIQEKKAMVDQTALDLQFSLVQTWIKYHGAFQLEKVLKAQQKTNAEILKLINLRLAQGDGNALDILQQQGRIAYISRALPEVISKKEQYAHAYAVLLGKLPDHGIRPRDEWPVLKKIPAIPSPRELLADRSDLKAVFWALQAADQNVAMAIAERLPRISIGLNHTLSGRAVADFGKGRALSFVSGILMPVFDAGRLKANVSAKKAQALENLALLEQSVLNAVQEVEDALVKENALSDEHQLLKKEVSIAMETVDRSKFQYLNGRQSFLSVLVTLEKLQNLQKNEIQLKQALLINRGYLLKALSAEWSDPHENS